MYAFQNPLPFKNTSLIVSTVLLCLLCLLRHRRLGAHGHVLDQEAHRSHVLLHVCHNQFVPVQTYFMPINPNLSPDVMMCLSYYAMGSNLGMTPISVEFKHSPAAPRVEGFAREIFWVRYVQWYVVHSHNL